MRSVVGEPFLDLVQSPLQCVCFIFCKGYCIDFHEFIVQLCKNGKNPVWQSVFEGAKIYFMPLPCFSFVFSKCSAVIRSSVISACQFELKAFFITNTFSERSEFTFWMPFFGLWNWLCWSFYSTAWHLGLPNETGDASVNF